MFSIIWLLSGDDMCADNEIMMEIFEITLQVKSDGTNIINVVPSLDRQAAWN
jgi:hypothetical protein